MISTRVNGEGVPITTCDYAANGTDHELQRDLTELMSRLVTERGEFSLAEVGYLHMSTLTYDHAKNSLDLRVYFDVHLALRAVPMPTSRNRVLAPLEELKVFENYLYVGSLADAITVEKVLGPKIRVNETGDELGRMSLTIKDGSKYEEMDVAVLHCNIYTTMAAILGIPLDDPEFDVRCSPVGKGGKHAEERVIMTVAATEVPVEVTVTYTTPDDDEEYSYDPNDAVPYLTALATRASTANQNKRDLARKVKKKAKKARAKNANSAAFNKFA